MRGRSCGRLVACRSGLVQKERVQRVTVAGRFATVNWVAPQWQLPFAVISIVLRLAAIA
jgi:hypothetical protein